MSHRGVLHLEMSVRLNFTVCSGNLCWDLTDRADWAQRLAMTDKLDIIKHCLMS
jgi:hypothetical protein